MQYWSNVVIICILTFDKIAQLLEEKRIGIWIILSFFVIHYVLNVKYQADPWSSSPTP